MAPTLLPALIVTDTCTLATRRGCAPTAGGNRRPMKDIIARGGNKIAAAEIDALLARHPQVTGALCAGVPDVRLGEAIHAIVTLVPGTRLTPKIMPPGRRRQRESGPGRDLHPRRLANRADRQAAPRRRCPPSEGGAQVGAALAHQGAQNRPSILPCSLRRCYWRRAPGQAGHGHMISPVITTTNSARRKAAAHGWYDGTFGAPRLLRIGRERVLRLGHADGQIAIASVLRLLERASMAPSQEMSAAR